MINNIDDTLFPRPTISNSSKNPWAPPILPGISPATTEILRSLLQDNHDRWHIFFNDRGFHNHSAHFITTLWALGANENVIKNAYDKSCLDQKPSITPPGAISRENWTENLGDSRYYRAYVDFYKGELERNNFDYGILVEEYILSPSSNHHPDSKKDKQEPLMLNRFLSGVFHSIIHAGFGVEFNLPGLFVEGMALASSEKADARDLFPRSMFEISALTTKDVKDVHALTIIGRILGDDALSNKEPHGMAGFYQAGLEKHRESICRYVDQWTFTEDVDLNKKMEELIWVAVLLYAAGGLQSDGVFNADFFFMHFVTSSLFLPTVFNTLRKPSSKILLLKGYLAIILSWYIAHGRPQLDLHRFFTNQSSLIPSPKGISPDKLASNNSNPWLTILQATLPHPDDHLAKLQRALSTHAIHFGSTPKGTFGNVVGLEGAEEIDGTLFLRAAVLTMNQIVWYAGERKLSLGLIWDRHGFHDA